MAQKTKTMEITIVDEGGTFNTFFRRFTGDMTDYDFEGLSVLRNLLSNEKAKILHVLRTKNPISIYHLAKMVGRDFKSVREDIKVLERFGLIDMVAENSGKRARLRPILNVNTLNIVLKF